MALHKITQNIFDSKYAQFTWQPPLINFTEEECGEVKVSSRNYTGQGGHFLSLYTSVTNVFVNSSTNTEVK